MHLRWWNPLRGLTLLSLLASAPTVWGQPGDVGYVSDPVMGTSAARSSAYPKGDFAAQLAAAGGSPGGCGGACDWGWGAGGSPFRTGPGDCDDWRVGPHWHGSIDGVVMFREGADLVSLAGAANAGGVALPLDAGTVTENFNHGVGGRLTLRGEYPQCRGYSLDVTYLGVPGWNASAYDPEVVPPGPIGVGTVAQRSLEYQSSIHSVEINIQPTTDRVLALYGGSRFIRLAEDVEDSLDVSGIIPVVSTEPPLDVTDVLRRASVSNNLIGFQGGVRSNLLNLTERLRLEGFADAGVYCNLQYRESRLSQTRTFIRRDDPATVVNEGVDSTVTSSTGYDSDRARIAYTGESHLAAVMNWNRCFSTRAGYQVLYLDGLELADDAFRGGDPLSRDLLLHGWFAGLEYKR